MSTSHLGTAHSAARSLIAAAVLISGRLEGVPGLSGVDVSRVVAHDLNDRSEVLLNLVQGDHDPDGAIAIWNARTGAITTHPELLDVAWADDINDLGRVVGAVSGRPFTWDQRTAPARPRTLLDGVGEGGQRSGSDHRLVVRRRGRVARRALDRPRCCSSDDPRPIRVGLRHQRCGLALGIHAAARMTWHPPGVWDSASGEWLDVPVQWGHSIRAMNDLGQFVGLVGEEQPAIWRPR